ncbi:MAG: lipopolysaccharide export system permease protein [Candidatus Hydrogenedentes bacterium]|nr:lipopolysaccharide export system permease protein [Candidatus Hydrogenedentota bacterium]
MKRLNLYVLVQIAIPSLLAVAVIAVIAVATELQDQLRNLPLSHVNVGDMGRLIFYFMPTLISYVVPITYMMGILLAFGRLSQYGEIVAMKAAGIPLKRVVAPVIVVGALLSAGSFLLQDRAQPWAIGKVYEMVFRELPNRITLDVLAPGVMHEFRGWRVHIGHKNPETGALEDIVILQPEERKQGAVAYLAESAQLVDENGRSVLVMKNGYSIPAANEDTVSPVTFDEFRCAIPAFTAKVPPVTRTGMTVAQLYQSVRKMRAEAEATQSEVVMQDLKKEQQEVAERLSIPFACLAVSFVAAPLGARAKRSGKSYTFAVGFGIVLVYYVLKLVVEPRSVPDLATVIFCAWIPNLVLCVAGVFFVWRVDRI